jgi:hypothetical protein
MPAAAKHDVHDLTSVLDVLQEKIDSDNRTGSGGGSITLKQVLQQFGRRSYGPLLLIIGLISISPAALLPGSTTIFATLTLLVALQLLFHRDHPWMPGFALRMKFSERRLEKFIRFCRPATKLIDKVIRPRFTFLSEQPWVTGVALLVVLAALITYPLSFIPIAPLLPGLAIALFGLGMTARDGLLLAFGAGIMGVAGYIIAARLF